jgi:Fur family peroxide stress response transcriptional regulator
MRLTPHRREVFQVLSESTDHPTANEVYHRLRERKSSISLATVYNCLDQLRDHGVIKQVNVERSQSRFCANLHEHVHFHCERCGAVSDADPIGDLQADAFWNLPKGARVTRTDVAIRGLCASCVAATQA